MPNAVLTDSAIRATRPPDQGTTTLWDASLKGFGVRVSQGGTRTFIVLIGSGRRQTIGRYPLIGLSTARTEAKRLLAEKTLGKVRPTHLAFEDALEAFLKESGRKNRPRTVVEYKRLLNRHFAFKRTSIGAITLKDIYAKLKGLDDAPAERRAAFVAARAFFGWCVRKRILDRSPLDRAEAPPASEPRERVLADDELVRVWNAARTDSPFHCLVRLAILSGQRRGELAGVQPDWLQGSILTFPSTTTKNKVTHAIPCTPRMIELLSSSPFRFNGWSKAKAALDKAASVSGWRLHDLRRTFASGMQQLGVRMEVTEKLLNHKSGSFAGIVGVYQRYGLMPEMRDAITRWEAHLAKLLDAPRHAA